MEKTNAIGLMSGTSLDGLDIAHCSFWTEANQWKYEIINCETIGYDDFWKTKLSNAQNLNSFDLNILNNEFGDFVGSQTAKFIHKHKINPNIVASHGHTVFHAPKQGLTLQIGSGHYIRKHLNCMVINDFRSSDVALGGQGAPLVPIGDQLLFGNFGACINIGGFSNISMHENGQRVAWDICPANIVLNELASKLGKSFDDGGSLAKSGNLIINWLEELNSIDYYAANYPKSLGREWVEENIYPIITTTNKIQDLLATFTIHIANQIAKAIETVESDILITGGGAFNKFLVNKIIEISGKKIVIPENKLIEFKEALIFAFMGVLRSQGQTNVLSSVTGAKLNSSSGVIFM